MSALPRSAASVEALKKAPATVLGARAPSRPALACPCRLGGSATAERCSPEGINHVGRRPGAIAVGVLEEAPAAVLSAQAPARPALACLCRRGGSASVEASVDGRSTERAS